MASKGGYVNEIQEKNRNDRHELVHVVQKKEIVFVHDGQPGPVAFPLENLILIQKYLKKKGRAKKKNQCRSQEDGTKHKADVTGKENI